MEINETTFSNDDFASRKAFTDFIQSKGEILETTIVQWIDNQLFAVVCVLVVLGVISTTIPWYALIPVIIGGLLFVTTLGAYQLRSYERLTEKSFMSLMLETLRRIVMLKDRTLPSSHIEKSPEADDTKEMPKQALELHSNALDRFRSRSTHLPA